METGETNLYYESETTIKNKEASTHEANKPCQLAQMVSINLQVLKPPQEYYISFLF